jgi:hypothetical protein
MKTITNKEIILINQNKTKNEMKLINESNIR